MYDRWSYEWFGFEWFSALLGTDNLDEFYAADAEDPIHRLLHISGWSAGQTSAELVNPILRFYEGDALAMACTSILIA